MILFLQVPVLNLLTEILSFVAKFHLCLVPEVLGTE